MSDFKFWFGLIPPESYGYLIAAALFVFFMRSKIPILKDIQFKVSLPEEYMRNFRWITPLMVAGQYVLQILIYAALLKIISMLIKVIFMVTKIAVHLGVQL